MATAEQQVERRRERLQEVRLIFSIPPEHLLTSRHGVTSQDLNLVTLTNVCSVQLVEQCEDEQLIDVVLPRLTKVLSLWELLLAKVSTPVFRHFHVARVRVQGQGSNNTSQIGHQSAEGWGVFSGAPLPNSVL